MLKGLVVSGLSLVAFLAWVGLGWASGAGMTEPFNNLEFLTAPVVTSTSSGIWFLTLAIVGWRASEIRPTAARTKTH